VTTEIPGWAIPSSTVHHDESSCGHDFIKVKKIQSPDDMNLTEHYWTLRKHEYVCRQ